MTKISIKTADEIEIMAEGGKKLAQIRDEVAKMTKPGVTTMEMETFAQKMIKESGGKASFAMVPGYKYALCVSINDEVVHGLPSKRKVENGDLVSIDVGLYYKGFHTDTSVSIVAGKASPEVTKFLGVGRNVMKKTLALVKVGKRIADLSECMQTGVEAAGYGAIRALTGHGVGKQLHEEPAIPCFVMGSYDYSPKIVAGMVIAVELMYTAGSPDVMYKNHDGWTISTADGKIAGLFEETVAVTPKGPIILTASHMAASYK
jgi:methionyl aminopeptidase